jgi:peptidyl-prolyl cis-trans isomerase D
VGVATRWRNRWRVYLLERFSKQSRRSLKAYSAQTGRGPSEQELAMMREQVWNQYILDFAYGKEYEVLGLSVSPEELVDMVQGNNIHPSVRQQFTNPQTGQFDKNYVFSF